MKKIFFYVWKLLPTQSVHAHCDIPCGIYDPHNAQMAAHTVLRMTQMINDLNTSKDEPDSEERKKIISQLSRLTHVKEKHAELVEEELGTLENDYFKAEHFKNFPKLKGLIEKAVKLSISARQNIDEETCQKLIETVMEIAEIFYKTKNLMPVHVTSGYPTEGKIVIHK